MVRHLPKLLALATTAVLGLGSAPALADAGAMVRAMMAETTGHPVRQIHRADPADLRAARALSPTALRDDPGHWLSRAVGISPLAPLVSLWPRARPALLVPAGCDTMIDGAVQRPCARPLDLVAAPRISGALAAPTTDTAEAAAPTGQAFVITDGRVRVLGPALPAR